MQSKSKFNDAEVRPQVTTRGGHLLHEKCPDLRGQLIELERAQLPQIARLVDLIQQCHADPSTIRSIAHDGHIDPRVCVNSGITGRDVGPVYA